MTLSLRAPEVTTANPSLRKQREGEEPKLDLQELVHREACREVCQRISPFQGWQDQESEKQLSRRKRKRQSVEKEVAALTRPLLASSSTASRVLLSDLSRKTLCVENTRDGSTFLETNSELFCNVSRKARTQFVIAHTPIALLEHGHVYGSGVFMGPGVTIPKDLEWQLALNLKFILHHNPNAFKVMEAWKHLQRSVRIAWHFRDSSRMQSKFYVPKRTWMPPPEEWNIAIERGLDAGKDLLFSQASVLIRRTAHRSNPDLRQLKDFIESNQILMKITDKNLGVAAISKDWYVQQCSLLLKDTSTYDEIIKNDVHFYQREAHKRLQHICENAAFSEQVQEFILSSFNEESIPEFHAIPKVHKAVWKLRPIVPSHSWVSTKASEVCDFALRALHKAKYPWVVDSTREVIRRVEKHTILRTQDVWIVTGDVESFYTNVNVEATLNGIRHELQGFPSEAGVDMQAIADLAQVVMFTNCFGFRGQYFHQTSGIAMGTSCAPSFANVNLGMKEALCPEIVNQGTKSGLSLYVRYIDDILLIYRGSRTALEICLENISA